MKDSLIERYVYAVAKRLPSKMQEDVIQEIRGLIDDMLLERCGDVKPSEKDIRVVLTELGSPKELAEKYDTSAKNCLIGPPYFVTYKYVLKIVLVCVGIAMLVSSVFSTVIDSVEVFKNAEIMLQSTKFWIDLFSNMFVMVAEGLVFCFAFVTLLFAVFYHKDIKIDNENLDNLPPVPKKEISRADCIVGIAVSVVFAVVFLAAPQIFGVILDGKSFVSILNVSYVQRLWYVIVIFALLGISREVIKLIERQYNKKVMITTVITNVCSAVTAVFWLFNDNIINKDFIAAVTNALQEDIPLAIFSNFNYFFLFCILLALTIDTLVAVIKTIKNRK